jgi:cathepsin A (carboxypeptidase C)
MNWENNWYGQMRWLSKLDWYGQVRFNNAMDADWYSYVSGQKAGKVRNYDNLTFVKVYDAGQFVSMMFHFILMYFIRYLYI